MKMHDLGYTYDTEGSQPIAKVDDKTTHYPHLSLNEKNLKSLGKVHCEVGEEYIGTLRLKVTSQREDEYGSGIEFAVTQMSDLSKSPNKNDNVMADDDEEEEETGDGAADNEGTTVSEVSDKSEYEGDR